MRIADLLTMPVIEALSIIEGLISLMGKLKSWRNEDNVKKRKLVENLYKEFSNIHQVYLDHFSKYRDEIIKRTDLKSIRDEIEKDNIFTRNARMHTFQLMRSVNNEQIIPLVESIAGYLINPYKIDYESNKVDWEDFREDYNNLGQIQYFRNTLSQKISSLIKDKWIVYYDPTASAPPLDEESINQRQADDAIKFQVSLDNGLSELKYNYILKDLDDIVGELQYFYEQITSKYYQTLEEI